MKNKRFVSWKVIVPIQVICGVLIMIITFIIACNSDMRKAQQCGRNSLAAEK